MTCYTISVVPPGGGEQDYQFTVRGAAFIPRPGEYVVVGEAEMDTKGVIRAFNRVRQPGEHSASEGRRRLNRGAHPGLVQGRLRPGHLGEQVCA